MSALEDTTIWRNRTFLHVWAAGVFAMLGFSMLFLTTSWYVINELNMPAFVGVVLTVITVPRVVMMIFGGVVADRKKKSKVMFVTNSLQTLMLCILTMLLAFDALTILPLLIGAFIFGVLDAFFYPAVMALIPSAVAHHQIQRANSVFHGTVELMFLFGPLLAGLLLTVSNYTVTLAVAAVFVGVSAIAVYPRFIHDVPASTNSDETPQAVGRDLMVGLRYVQGSQMIRSGILAIVYVNLFVIGPMIVSFPILVDDSGGTAFDLSLLEAGLSVGTFAASFCVYIISQRPGRGRIVSVTLLLTMGAFFVFSQVESIPALMVWAAVAGFGCMIVYLPSLTIIQEHTDEDKLGRVMSVVTVASEGFAPVAFAIVSLFVGVGIHINAVLTTASLAGVVLALLFLLRAHLFRTSA
ncbi:transmembrane secretion effector [Salsuginibacillus halophilus]|uniref:Transmembrane secretion effector n=1 Tax=Salsuginibacillus halophilus TaxID=517424 RepID=A0A2P8HQL2_9BACI|nr:MFS transporter [Salsuginibacillus halophilus]PSL48511.1 transmembrane secretion effector [Salsuginibacillus halophilus]